MERLRRVITGTGPDGRSRVVKDGEPGTIYGFGADLGSKDPHDLGGQAPGARYAAPPEGGFVLAELWASDGNNPVGHDPDTMGEAFEVECPPGGSRWRLVTFGPHRTSSAHRTSTLDCNVVLEGSVELLLDEGAVTLERGDLVVLPGTLHRWRTGDTGCTLVIMMRDLQEPAD